MTQNSGEAVCIGCGCCDSHACVTALTLDNTELSACFWIKVDYELGIGVCSECPEKVEEFEGRLNKFHREGAKNAKKSIGSRRLQPARRTA